MWTTGTVWLLRLFTRREIVVDGFYSGFDVLFIPPACWWSNRRCKLQTAFDMFEQNICAMP